MRQRGRRRSIRRRNRTNHYWGMGPQVEDGISGWLRPVSETVLQRGVPVSNRLNDDSLDRPKSY